MHTMNHHLFVTIIVMIYVQGVLLEMDRERSCVHMSRVYANMIGWRLQLSSETMNI